MSNSYLLGTKFKIVGTFREAKILFAHFHFAQSLLYYYSIIANIITNILKYILITAQTFTLFFLGSSVISVDNSGIWFQKQNRHLECTCFHLLEFRRKFWSAQQVSLLLLWNGNIHIGFVFFCQSQIANLLILQNTLTVFFIITCWSARKHNECALTCGLTFSCILDTGSYKFFAHFSCSLATSALAQRRWS